MSNTTLTLEDLRNMIAVTIAAIQLDQQRADRLRPELQCHKYYDPEMWRHWRDDWIACLNHLLATLDTVTPAMLQDLTELARHRQPELVEYCLNDNLTNAVLFMVEGEMPSDDEQYGDAARFFRSVTESVSWLSDNTNFDFEKYHLSPDLLVVPEKDIIGAARKWFPPMQDPLRISEDPECQYGKLTGGIN